MQVQLTNKVYHRPTLSAIIPEKPDHPTPAGQAELDRWLQEDVPERFSKDDFLTKLFFCGETSDEVALKHLLEHRASLLNQLEHMEWARQQYATRPTRRPRLLEYQMLVRDYKEAVLKAGIEVTERAIDRLQAKENRSEEHTSELQSQSNLVCRLLLEK